MAKTTKRKGKAKSRMFIVVSLLMGIVFLPSTALLVVGMLPSAVAFVGDRARRKSRTMGVAAMNFAGCTPFLIELWTTENNFDKSFSILSNPKAVVVMYAAAGAGYLINWAMSGITVALLYERGIARKAAIIKRQKDLVDRWGEEVTGKLPLDADGFPIERSAAPDEKTGGLKAFYLKFFFTLAYHNEVWGRS